MNKIDLNKYFPETEITTEIFKGYAKDDVIFRFKKMQLSTGLSLTLFGNGQATLVLKNNEGNAEHTFLWDDEVAEMFERFDEVRAVDLFEMIYRKRWRTG